MTSARLGSPRRDGLPILIGLLFLLAWEFGGLDLPLARHFGNASGFYWRDHWLTEGLLHGGAHAIAWIILALLVAGVWRPLPFNRPLSRRDHLLWIATTALCVVIILLIRRSSWTSCPWSLVEFGGGLAQYVPHWTLGRHDGGPGHCFPSGHASSAFSMLAGWYVLRDKSPSAARILLVIIGVAGASLAWMQMMRGAHYLSHSLWTAWICWGTTALSFHGSRSWREREGHARRCAAAGSGDQNI
jgi:membrane-associated PAP2 superfamily phosphatase